MSKWKHQREKRQDHAEPGSKLQMTPFHVKKKSDQTLNSIQIIILLSILFIIS